MTATTTSTSRQHQIEVLVFYLGFTPRQLLLGRCVCKRWAALLSEQRFWYRHVAALPPPLLPLLGVPTGAMSLWRWYAEVAGRVRTYWDGPVMRLRSQALWEALLWAAAGGGEALHFEAASVGCVSYVRRPGKPALTVSLGARVFSPPQREVRRAWVYGQVRKRQRALDHEDILTTVPIIHVWCSAERRAQTLVPAALSERLLGILLDGRPCPMSCILE